MKSTTRLKAVAGTDIAAAAPKYEYDRVLGLVRLLEAQLQWFDSRRPVLDDLNLPDQFWDEVAEATYEATKTKIRIITLTKQPATSSPASVADKAAGAPAAVTPEMIEAGMLELSRYGGLGCCDDPAQMLADIFRVMREVASE